MSRRFTDRLIEFEERAVCFPGLLELTGFNQIGVEVEKKSKGTSTYTLRRKISQFIDSVTSFSDKPLRLISYFGAMVFIIACIYALYLVYKRLFLAAVVPGWTLVTVSIWILGGITIMFLGIIGIYISKIFMEIKKRPYSIVKDIYGDLKEIKD